MSKNQEPINSYLSTENKPARKIKGGCHCGAVQFKATVQPNTVILDCNCSICLMTGFQHLIIKHQNFNLISGSEQLIEYQFNTGQAQHLFCGVCGVKSFYQPRSHPDSWSINTRCVIDFDPNEWHHESFDGQNWQQSKDLMDQQL